MPLVGNSRQPPPRGARPRAPSPERALSASDPLTVILCPRTSSSFLPCSLSQHDTEKVAPSAGFLPNSHRKSEGERGKERVSGASFSGRIQLPVILRRGSLIRLPLIVVDTPACLASLGGVYSLRPVRNAALWKSRASLQLLIQKWSQAHGKLEPRKPTFRKRARPGGTQVSRSAHKRCVSVSRPGLLCCLCTAMATFGDSVVKQIGFPIRSQS